jgi:hypothetical protein
VCGEVDEIVEGGQLRLGGFDGVSDVVEEPAGEVPPSDWTASYWDDLSWRKQSR